MPNYSWLDELKTTWSVSKARLDVRRKKKTELVAKERYTIADHVRTNKAPRARIAVEHIIREDYRIEAMDRVEAYIETLLARLSLLKNHPKGSPVDPSIEAPLCNLLWATPFLSQDIPELLVSTKILKKNFGPEYIAACEQNKLNLVDTDLLRCLSCDHIPKLLVEKYLIEICRSQNVPFEPNESVMVQDEFWAVGSKYVQENNSSSNDEKRFPPPPNDFSQGGAAARPHYAPPPPPVHYENPPPRYMDPGVNYPHLNHGPSLPPPFPHPSSSATPKIGFPTPPKPFEQPIDRFPAVPFGGPAGFSSGSSAPPPPDDSDFNDLHRRFDQLRNQK